MKGITLLIHQAIFGKETPEQYRARHAKLDAERALREFKRKNTPYRASDGNIYSHRETQSEYYARKLKNALNGR